MTRYKTNIQLKNAAREDYDRLDREMAIASFDKRGREYHYRGDGSLQEIAVGAYLAAHNTGKEYSLTITRNAAHA